MEIDTTSRIDFLEHLCDTCGGSGYLTYGSTATFWGGQAMITDVCDRCWGSGDADEPWPNRKKIASMAQTLTAYRMALAEALHQLEDPETDTAASYERFVQRGWHLAQAVRHEHPQSAGYVPTCLRCLADHYRTHHSMPREP